MYIPPNEYRSRASFFGKPSFLECGDRMDKQMVVMIADEMAAKVKDQAPRPRKAQITATELEPRSVEIKVETKMPRKSSFRVKRAEDTML